MVVVLWLLNAKHSVIVMSQVVDMGPRNTCLRDRGLGSDEQAGRGTGENLKTQNHSALE